ncbi:carbohydrate-binding module family 12 protein [Gigaspora margarita]|uniref:Carbohydrate-binding module family 12 protein n=1 Tax=Gigaspora margarita TaxID=4874 RepID=A0A8H4AYS9_GIGMA|nr:carbohydrate-binding module family 12 protein [Gigaspora margarita]
MAVAQDHWAAKWCRYQGHTPHDAFRVGHHAIGRGNFEGGLHIGYIDQHKQRLIIGWGGKQHELHEFEVLCVPNEHHCQFKWNSCNGACRPQFFIPLKGGHESDGRELYIAKACHGGEERIGKAGQHLINGMSFACDGQEVICGSYEVLSFTN